MIATLTSLPKLRTPSAGILSYDKLAHFIVYLVLAYLYVKMSSGKNTEQLMRSLMLMVIIIPFADELHQIPIPGREFSIFDVLADMLGFILIMILVKKKIAKPVSN